MALYAGGHSLLLLALFYWVIDVKMIKSWAFFFIVIGMNAITIFFVRSFVSFDQIANFFLKGIAGYGPSFGKTDFVNRHRGGRVAVSVVPLPA